MHFSWKRKFYGLALGAIGYGLGATLSIVFFIFSMWLSGPLVLIMSPAIMGWVGGAIFGLLLPNRSKIWSFAGRGAIVATGSSLLLLITVFDRGNPLMTYAPLFLGAYLTSFVFLRHCGVDRKNALQQSLKGLFASLLGFCVALPYAFHDFVTLIIVWGFSTGGLMGFFLTDLKPTQA